MSPLRIKNTSESDPHSYEETPTGSPESFLDFICNYFTTARITFTCIIIIIIIIIIITVKLQIYLTDRFISPFTRGFMHLIMTIFSQYRVCTQRFECQNLAM